jgi:ribonuclease E
MLENEAETANGADGTEETISSETTSETIGETGNEATSDQTGLTSESAPRRRRAASRPAGPPPDIEDFPVVVPPRATASPAEHAVESTTESVPAPEPAPAAEPVEAARAEGAERPERPARSRSRRRGAATEPAEQPEVAEAAEVTEEAVEIEIVSGGVPAVTFQAPMVVFQPPAAHTPAPVVVPAREEAEEEAEDTAESADQAEDDESADRSSRRRRRRGGRGRGKARETAEESADEADRTTVAKGGKASKATRAEAKDETSEQPVAEAVREDTEDDEDDPGSTRRRRRRRRRASGGGDGDETIHDDPPNTVVHVREPRAIEDEVQSVKGSTRLEAKKQRRREGREQGRRRPPIITESEFLARREAVERLMVVRQEGERTQIAVLEDDVLVEHYVDRATHQSYVGNVYLGKVQNVLPSMEAAFVDIGKGRNAVLYAGEVNWDVAGLEGQPRRIESALKSGQSVLVQVTKDPLGHKGARLTSQISLPGRYLVYVPDGSMTGISRKLPDKERARLKQILKRVMPENAGVIVRTAAEGATEEELARDVSRLAAQWENIQRQAKTANAPELLYGEPDLTIRVVRDIFNEDFSKLVVSGEDAWATVEDYVSYVAPHLADRAVRWTQPEDVLTGYRIDEQLAKALDRKVWLPSGGSLVIDRTEAMTVIDVNTGKFTGQGGNLEETVTRNNLEAAEEIVRQLRLRDLGGIIVIDFIDMVLESNRDLVLRRLLECLARDRTKHQVAEVTSLGLVQMTRKRVGQGLLEAFSEVCECCNGRGIHVSLAPVESKPEQAAATGRRRKRKGEVEKTVERKLARHETQQVEDRAPEADTETEGADADGTAGRRQSGRSRSSRARAVRAQAAPPEVDEPAAPAGSVEPDEPAAPAESATPDEPAEHVEFAEQVEPAEHVESAEQVEPAEHVESADRIEPAEQVESAAPDESTERAELVWPEAAQPEAVESDQVVVEGTAPAAPEEAEPAVVEQAVEPAAESRTEAPGEPIAGPSGSADLAEPVDDMADEQAAGEVADEHEQSALSNGRPRRRSRRSRAKAEIGSDDTD